MCSQKEWSTLDRLHTSLSTTIISLVCTKRCTNNIYIDTRSLRYPFYFTYLIRTQFLCRFPVCMRVISRFLIKGDSNMRFFASGSEGGKLEWCQLCRIQPWKFSQRHTSFCDEVGFCCLREYPHPPFPSWP